MASLGPAVNSLRSSLALLNNSISILDNGVSDFPRLCKVLETQQHFELVPESKLRLAQQSLVDEIAPAIEQLISTAEAYVDQLGRKEQSLKARYELNEGRLGDDDRKPIVSRGGKTSRLREKHSDLVGSGETRSLEVKRLQQKKERLQYAIERLELQSKQRERELRKILHTLDKIQNIVDDAVDRTDIGCCVGVDVGNLNAIQIRAKIQARWQASLDYNSKFSRIIDLAPVLSSRTGLHIWATASGTDKPPYDARLESEPRYKHNAGKIAYHFARMKDCEIG